MLEGDVGGVEELGAGLGATEDLIVVGDSLPVEDGGCLALVGPVEGEEVGQGFCLL